MADRILNIAVLLEARTSRMTTRRANFSLIAAFALIGATAVAIFAPLASATAGKSTRPAATADEIPAQGLSLMVADHDAANRQAVDTIEAVVARATVETLAEPAVAATELLRSAKPSAPAARTIRMLVTAYCPCKKCCGPNAQGITASGKHVSHNGGRFVAADKSVLKLGTKLIVPGYAGETAVEVLDTGSAIKGNRLDVYYPSHQTALEWGKQWVDVVVVD
jgi:3D (Asp-Asp-Asp) domain-containing protein